MPNKENRYYVYTLAYPESMGGTIFYVGKGSGGRINRHEVEAHQKGDNCNAKKLDVIRSIHQAGLSVVKTIVFETSDKSETAAKEKQLIALFSPMLTNIQHNPGVNPRPKREPLPPIDIVAEALERGFALNKRLAAEQYPGQDHTAILANWNEDTRRRIMKYNVNRSA